MKAIEEIVEESIQTGVLSNTKEYLKNSLKSALKELDQEIRRKNEQITLLVNDTGRLKNERDSLFKEVEALRLEKEQLQLDEPKLKKSIEDYRKERLAAISKAQEAIDAASLVIVEKEKSASKREQAAQTAESSYSALLDKATSETGILKETIEGALKKVLDALKPKEQVNAPNPEPSSNSS